MAFQTRIFSFAFLLGLFFGIASAFDADFTNSYNTPNPYPVSTDVSIVPSLSLPKTLYCTNEPITPTVSVSTLWFINSYYAQLPSNANTLSCLFPYTTQNKNNPLAWLNLAQYNALSTHPTGFFSTNENFASYLSSNGIVVQTPLEPSTYRAPGGVPFNDGQTFESKIGVYSKGRLKLVSSNPAYSQTLAENFMGTVPAITPFSQSAPGTFTLASSIELIGLISTAETVLNEATCAQSNARIYFLQNPTLPQTYSSTPVSITVENPFACQLSAQSGTYSPIPVNQSATLSFSFMLNNGGNRPLAIQSASNISLAPASQFSNLLITTPFPIAVPSGGSTQIQGTVRAPATSGNHPLNLRISSQTTLADCTGLLVSCTANSLLVVNVVVAPPPIRCSLSFPGGNTNLLPGGSEIVRASCTQGGSTVNCPALSWSQNVQGGSLSPATTGSSINPSTNLSIALSAPYPQEGQVNATNGTLVCEPALFSVDSPGVSLSCGFLNNGGIFFPGQSALFRANCTVGGVPNSQCPALNWTTSINGANMNPAYTAPNPSPRSSVFSTTASTPVNQIGNVIVRCTDPTICGPCRVSAQVVPYPDHLSCYLVGHGPIFSPNDSSQVQGSCSFANSSTACPPLFWFTNITNANLLPENTPSTFLPNTTFTIQNGVVGEKGIINATSLLPGFSTLYCDPAIDASVENLGVDYVVHSLLLSKTILQVGESLSVEVMVKNTGNQDASNNTITAILGGCTGQLSIPPLDAHANATRTFSCVCSTAGLNVIDAVANFDFNQFELNYTNNNKTAIFQCGAAFAPMCIDYI